MEKEKKLRQLHAMDQNIIEKFTTHLKSVLVRAYTLAHELNQSHITPDHLLWSLLTERGCLGAEILQKAHISHEHVREAIAQRVQKGGAASTRRVPVQDAADIPLPTLSDTTKRAIEKAVLTASVYEHKFVGTEHLLSGMLQTEDAFLLQLLTAEAVDIAALKEQITTLLKSTSAFPDLAEDTEEEHTLTLPKTPQEEVPEEGDETKRIKRPGSKTPALDFFTIDLTSPEAQKRIDPVIGREKEIERMVQILARRTKNNPVLLGDPGVGKTAIVEGLARRIVQGTVPDVLRGKRLLGLDLALVVAGTVYRGEFEGRIKQIIDEIKIRPDIILFIDEVHNISGTGAASGSMDAANILKPALARGEIRCIGATTITEYKKSIESDPALDRRFQAISVHEPSPAETEEILRGIRSQYETFHSVHISDEAITAAVALGGRYLQDRTFPDKAIDLIDEASAALRVKLGSPKNKERTVLEEKLAAIKNKKQEAVQNEQFVEALELKEQEATLALQLSVLENTKPKTIVPAATIGQRDIASVIAHITGVPESSILAEETGELEDLEKRLAQRVVGQDVVLRSIGEHVRRARAGLTRPGRPLGSFLFLGQSGVGKTSLATALAEELFHDPKALLRLDMSEFGESFTVSKMLGSPAGYVGYRDGTKLTDLIKRRPYSVVLFDEVEKAHPDVLNILLQILEDGKLTDATGRTVYFSHALIILTSNIGGEKFRKGTLGFASENASGAALLQDVRREAQQFFRPELINRLDNILVFRPLDTADISTILTEELRRINTHIAHRGIRVRVTPKAVKLLVAACDAGRMGARAVRTVLQEKIESPLATRLLAGTMGKQRVFTVDAANDTLRYH